MFNLCLKNQIYIFKQVYYLAISNIFRNKRIAKFQRKLSKQENQTHCLRRAHKTVEDFIEFCKDSRDFSLVDFVKQCPHDIPNSFIAKIKITYEIEEKSH